MQWKVQEKLQDFKVLRKSFTKYGLGSIMNSNVPAVVESVMKFTTTIIMEVASMMLTAVRILAKQRSTK